MASAPVSRKGRAAGACVSSAPALSRPKASMAQLYYYTDADLSLLNGKTVAIIGYRATPTP